MQHFAFIATVLFLFAFVSFALVSPSTARVIKEAGEIAVEPNVRAVPADHEVLRSGRRSFALSKERGRLELRGIRRNTGNLVISKERGRPGERREGYS